MKSITKKDKRDRRHRRVRAKVQGTEARPRLSIFKSNTRFVAQIIDDERGVTIAAADSQKEKGKTPGERAQEAAKTIAKRAQEKKHAHLFWDTSNVVDLQQHLIVFLLHDLVCRQLLPLTKETGARWLHFMAPISCVFRWHLPLNSSNSFP